MILGKLLLTAFIHSECYSPLLSTLTVLLSHVTLNDWLYLFIGCFWVFTQVVYLQHCLVVTWLVPCETAAISPRSVYAAEPCTALHHFTQTMHSFTSLNFSPKATYVRCMHITALIGRYMAGAMWNCCHLGTFCVHHWTMHSFTSLHPKPHM